MRPLCLVVPLVLCLAGCETTGPRIEVAFAAVVNGQPFSCTQSYPGVGTPGSTITPQDLRMYVSGVTLTGGALGPTPFVLDDGPQQSKADGVALLDFEDGTGTCTTDSPPPHTTLTGSAPADAYTGITFTLGVPQTIDQVVVTEARPPLDEPEMFQSGGVGYRYLTADVGTQVNPTWTFHLGADTCSATSDQSLVCKYPNLASIELDGWRSTSTIVFDLGVLLATSNLDATPLPPDTIAGCDSGDGDPECPPLFGQLGMTFEGMGTAGTQRVFTVR